MPVRRREQRRTVRVLRKVLMCSHPKKLKLSPLTAVEVLRSADPEELEIVDIKNDGKDGSVKHILFRGVPIYLSIKLSHYMQNMALI